MKENNLKPDYNNKAFIEQIPAAIAVFDLDMNYIVASKKWITDYKLTGKDIVGMSHYQLFPNTPAKWVNIYNKALQGEILPPTEEKFVSKSGRVKWILCDIKPWYDEKQQIGGLIICTEDITNQKAIRLENERIEEILDKTNEVARIGTWEVFIEEAKIIWSRITKEIHEVDDDFVPNMENAISFYKEGKSRDLIQNVVARAVETGESYDVELELTTAKGNSIWTRAIGHADFEDGKCVRLYGVFQDITITKNYEKSLKSAYAELSAILNSGAVSIIATDKNGLITEFNNGAETLLQYSAEEMIGIQTPQIIHVENEVINRGEELSVIYGEDIAGFEAFIAVAKREGHESREWTYVRKDGSTFNVELVVTTLKNNENEIVGYLGVATDVSERVAQRKELLDVNRDLEILTQSLTHKNKQLASFSHITSHNLRSPVGNLNSLLQFYKMADTDEEREMLFEKFEVVINHLTSTLTTLVDALKVKETDNQELQKVNFEEVLLKTKEMFIGQILESNAQINYNFEQVTDINYNASYLESIFLNLISNSIKYRSPDRNPIINIYTKIIDNRPSLIFEDNGLGIDLERHGEKLFGLNKTFHRHAEAKGVGLYMTKTQIESLGGKIRAESKVNKGTTFTINF